MKKWIIVALCAVGLSQLGWTQSLVYVKPELGYTHFLEHAVQIEAGPNWQGYYIEYQNAFTANIAGGVRLGSHFTAGIGLGYQNFEGQHGVSIYADLEFYPTRLKYYEGTEEVPVVSRIKPTVRPFVYIRTGFNQLWNQYEGGTQSAVGEAGLGFEYNFQSGNCIYLKGGLSVMQQSFLLPLGLGMRF